MSTRRLVVWITFLSVFAMAARVSVDTDTWWHLRTGQIIVEENQFPTTDMFSFTRAGEAWQGASVGWIMQVGLYLVFNTFGFGGLNILQALMVTAAFGFVYKTLSGGEFMRAFVIVLAAAVSGLYWAARPHLMTFLLAAILFWIFEDFRWRRNNRLWVLPLLMIIWSNSHGGFSIGMIFWGVYALNEIVQRIAELRGDREKKTIRKNLIVLKAGFQGRVGWIALTGLLMMLAAGVNRVGLTIWLYPFRTVSISVLQDFIQEWQSPNFHDLQVQPFAWLFLLTLGAVGISKQKLALTDFLLVAGFGYLSFLAARNIAVFAIVAPAVLTRHMEPALRDMSQRLGFGNNAEGNAPRWQSFLNRGLVAFIGLVVVIKVYSVYPEEANKEVFAQQAPVEAVAYLLDKQPDGPLLNSYNWGGYLIWAARDYPVFVDGRTDLYGDEIIIQWLQMVNVEENWLELLEQWNIRLILLEPSWPITKVLEGEGWVLLYTDEIAVIYGR